MTTAPARRVQPDPPGPGEAPPGRGVGPAALGAPAGDELGLRRVRLALLAVLGCYSAATVAIPALRLSVFAPELRPVLEVAGLCFVLFAALALVLPSTDDVGPARNAFVVALCVLALTNAVFSLGPVVAGDGLTAGQELAFYPWVASRYWAGLLFICATLEWPKLRAGPFVALALGGLAVTDAALVVLADHLPLPFQVVSDGAAPALEVTQPWGHAAIQVIPGALFALGSWLAGRLYRRTVAPVYWWLSLALGVQVFTQLHEALYPAILGPVVTSADVLRFLAFVLLLVGALVEIRLLYRARSAAVRLQQEDLRTQQLLLDELHDFAEREADFRTIVNHELATPLATLRAFAHVLTASTADTAPDAVRQAVQGVAAESRRLQELVARMEELRDLEHAEFRCDLRPVRVRPLLDDAARFASALPGSHAVVVRCPDVRAEADPVRVGQALRNVLANAARYSPAGSPITLECDSGAPGRLRIAVVDRGPGVPRHERLRVLGKYRRGPQAGRAEGAGLGLYVASRIAEAHGGSLWIEDAEPATPADAASPGTRVVIELRGSAAPQAPPAGGDSDPGSAAPQA
ncbi:MAG TPA: HAMP domain-containing sensor histidine kinase, partial [Egibacteraceae bacterium]|nr:HAMP domain-containing sensor histidine kinase [Egibacteraceae bacterium]